MINGVCIRRLIVLPNFFALTGFPTESCESETFFAFVINLFRTFDKAVPVIPLHPD